ncbi:MULTISPECIES: arsenate reductase/protein-tyrosine-phosphatase family protein [Microbacterium]|jgi:protein-tyrosine-phosphatase/DNA-binding HxlR family transcriptional regulator|uniref:arsenate reductase/protein-tyrosine-phosphatase family protein n=1 Tax=Microbacterium TaxID=33882 RepID=UPI001D17D2AB|nr:helix-turn-helix domain-containing protein [Microbacterium testaceum]MCC4247566.1 helix-turn-helix domain-containing protein [Microbacterium testaceum]
MNVERNSDPEGRAARHAALGDPSRLRIVDLLTLGDLSPSEIRASLGLPSNLVAHHLNVLESVGMVERSRSEADRRRSYVRLTEAALTGLTPGRTERARRVVFVCTANSARSQLAAALWATHSSIPAASGGTHPADRIAPGAVATAERHALTLPAGAPQRLDAVLTGSDFVITVCDTAHEEIGVTGDLHWSIPDPVRAGTDDAFDSAYIELERRISELAPRLTDH